MLCDDLISLLCICTRFGLFEQVIGPLASGVHQAGPSCGAIRVLNPGRAPPTFIPDGAALGFPRQRLPLNGTSSQPDKGLPNRWRGYAHMKQMRSSLKWA